MELFKQYPSLLNWLEPKYSLKKLRLLQFSDQVGPVLQGFLKSNKTDKEISLFLKSIEQKLQLGYQLLCPLNESFPAGLSFNFTCPTPLMFKGHLFENKKVVSVVGSRNFTDSTKTWMKQEFKAFLEESSDVVVASGGALGVDQLSHRLSLLTQTPTYCVLPAGLNNIYPRNLSGMMDQIIAEGGCVITPFPPHFPVYKSNFYYRNKVLVLLSDLVFVVEAKRRSGTMMTASLAAEHGVDLVTLPQPALASYMGNIDLLESGCHFVKDSKSLSAYVTALNTHRLFK